MITAASITGTYGNATFTLTNADQGGIGIREFEWDPTLTGDEQPYPDQSGAFDSYVQNRSQIITVRGKIVGTSAANAITQLNTLADAILPDQGTQSAFKHGTLYVTFAGQSQVYADFVTLAWSPIIDTTGGNTIEYEWTCRNPYGYFRFTSGGAVFKV